MLDKGFTVLFPKGFFKSDVNEKIHIEILSSYFKEKTIKRGNADKREPDVFIGDRPIELTLACDESKTQSFIRRLKDGKYSSQNVDKDIKKYIIDSIERKKSKNYFIDSSNIILSIFVTIPNYDWILGNYGSVFAFVFYSQRDHFFAEIRDKYIKTNKFKDIIIIVPGLAFDWFVFSINQKDTFKYVVKDKNIHNKDFPFAIFNNFSGLNNL